MTDENRSSEYLRKLTELFSGYRAEWLHGKIFEVFTKPSYFPQLITSHPCFLEGGRGTGKTTALRSLSYEGQAKLKAESSESFKADDYFGMYYRINTNRVRAFTGDEVGSATWIRLFGHYLNLELCELVVNFLKWYSMREPNAAMLTKQELRSTAISLDLDEPDTVSDLGNRLNDAKLRFERDVNNIGETAITGLSVQGRPIDLLMEQVKALNQFSGVSFFFLIDEYENLDNLQQRVLNTLIKHCGTLYSFKIGIRELGHRERSTLNPNETLNHPADYRLINITKELAINDRFSTFAAKVCNQRLEQVFGSDMSVPALTTLFPEISAEDEAEMLGVDSLLTSLVSDLAQHEIHGERFGVWLQEVRALEVFALSIRAESEGITIPDKLLQVLSNRDGWNGHYENYKHAYLFRIRRGKRGIRKYFAGWRVFCSLSGANIRYLLELVDQALSRHLEEGAIPDGPISPKIQTDVAQLTGRRNLRELEGLSLNGARLTRLLLGLGRVFQVMAEDPVGHTPEVNQFHLQGNEQSTSDAEVVDRLISDGIMHLALSRYPASKLQQQTHIRDSDYSIHPIFAPCFGFSHRKKRKIELSTDDITHLVDRPKVGIANILRRQNRMADVDLPDQMRLFEGYFRDD